MHENEKKNGRVEGGGAMRISKAPLDPPIPFGVTFTQFRYPTATR